MINNQKHILAQSKLDLNTLNLQKREDYQEFYALFSKLYNVYEEEIELFSDEHSVFNTVILSLALQEYIHESCYIYSPNISMYERTAKKYFNKVNYISMHDSEVYIAKNSFIILENPSCITGEYFNLENHIELWKAKEATVFIDERMLDFCDKQSAKEFIQTYEKLYVLKSMNYFYNISSLHTSFLITHKNNIDFIKAYELNSKPSIFELKYLQSLLEDEHFKQVHQAINSKNMIKLQKVIKGSGLFEKVYNSCTNVLIARLKKVSVKQFLEVTKSLELKIEDCNKYSMMDKNHIRLEIFNEEEIKAFEQKLKGLKHE